MYSLLYGEPSIQSVEVITNGFPMNDSMFFGIDDVVTPQSFPFVSSLIKKYDACFDFSSGSISKSVTNWPSFIVFF